MRRYWIGLAIAVLLPVSWAHAGPGVLDHLKCHKAKDSAVKAKYTADLASVHPSFPTETGCIIKVPAKLVCFPTAKTDVVPTPPNSVSGAFIFEKLACYKMKCPKSGFDVPVEDQFGSRTLTVKAPNIICAPYDFD